MDKMKEAKKNEAWLPSPEITKAYFNGQVTTEEIKEEVNRKKDSITIQEYINKTKKWKPKYQRMA